MQTIYRTGIGQPKTKKTITGVFSQKIEMSLGLLQRIPESQGGRGIPHDGKDVRQSTCIIKHRIKPAPDGPKPPRPAANDILSLPTLAGLH